MKNAEIKERNKDNCFGCTRMSYAAKQVLIDFENHNADYFEENPNHHAALTQDDENYYLSVQDEHGNSVCAGIDETIEK